jgi:hypothetical protein
MSCGVVTITEPLTGIFCDHGMQSMSIGYLVDEENPMIWRGPMVTQALEQMLRDTLWRGVDYMIILCNSTVWVFSNGWRAFIYIGSNVYF